MLEIA
ncbi:hypothetical protein Zm00014a_013130 [Zea mays]